MIREVRLLGDPVLRRRTHEVVGFDDDLAALVRDMAETMYAYDGVGLAANQVGDERRVTVIDVGESRDGSDLVALVNPRIVRRQGTIPSEEGCLSIPGVVETIDRAAEVEVEYQDPGGAAQRIVGTELLSRALQHEIDHLEGILFIDHLGSMKRQMVLRDWQRRRAELEA